MDKKLSGVSQTMSRFRGWIQAGATLLTNLHLPNFLKGGLYQGAGKNRLCAGAELLLLSGGLRSLPHRGVSGGGGVFQVQLLLLYHRLPLFCWACCWGALSAAFYAPSAGFRSCCTKSPTKKLSTKRLKPLTYLKYAVLLVMVFLLPAFLVNDVGMGDLFFCKLLPSRRAEGAIPLSLANSGIRAALGALFTWKFSILLSVIALERTVLT